MVKSATNAALLVQSAVLVGMGVSGVGVGLSYTGGDTVEVGDAVTAVGWVAVPVGTAVSIGVCFPQAEVINTRKRKTTSKFFLMQASFLFSNSGGRQFIIYTKRMKKNIFQKPNLAIHLKTRP
jgi:hypothetical protein